MGLVRVGVERGDGPGNSGGVHSSGVHNSGVRNSNASKASGATARGGNQHLAEAVAEVAPFLEAVRNKTVRELWERRRCVQNDYLARAARGLDSGFKG